MIIHLLASSAVAALAMMALYKSSSEKLWKECGWWGKGSRILLAFLIAASLAFIVAMISGSVNAIIIARFILGSAWVAITAVPCRLRVVREHRLLYIPRNILFASTGATYLFLATVDNGM